MNNTKKYIHFQLVDILKKETDREHPMRQKDLVARLGVDRATVSRAIGDLLDDPLTSRVYSVNVEKEFEDEAGDFPEKDKRSYHGKIYYENEFTTAELRWLIDGILFSRNVPHQERNNLIQKLCGLGNRYFQRHMENINRLSKDEPMNPQLFTNIEILDQAISKKRQVTLTYNYMGPEFRLEPTLNRFGEPYRPLINPYSIVARNGYYFLVCNNNHFPDVSNYRIDRMTDIEIMDTPVKPVRQVVGLENGLNIQEYMASNINMAYGKPILITFKATAYGLADAIDAFGKNIQIQEKEGYSYLCTVRTPAFDMERWALQHWDDITVLSPDHLIEDIKEHAQLILQRYE